MACFFLCFTHTVWAANEAGLTGLAVTRPSLSSPETQVTFKLNQAVDFKAFTLANPHRLVVDLQNTQYVFSHINAVNLLGTDITDFRHGIQKGYNLRMVFDLKEAMRFNIEGHPAADGFYITVTLSPTSIILPSPMKSEKPDQPKEGNAQANSAKTLQKVTSVILETTEDNVVAPVTSSPVEEKPIISEPAMPPEPIQVVEQTEQHKFIVVIDAGHGGKDPGAQGPGGTDEKNVTIAIARDLQALVRKHHDMRSVLTRKGDYYVGLRQRLMIARKAKGDIFVAIHADAFNEPDAEGASVFALSLHGASSEAALWLAKKENYSELGGIDLNGIQDMNPQIRSVLIDLSQTATIGASLQLGQNVIKQLGKITDLHHGVVEQAPFMVLKSPDIPSILVETGFISNPKEEARLKTEAYQEKIAEALMAGIDAYYKKNVQKSLPEVISAQ